jgi:hypothetical protein
MCEPITASAAAAGAASAAGAGAAGASVGASLAGAASLGGAAAASTPWLTYGSLGASLLSTAVGVYGQVQAGQAQAGQARYQAQVAQNNRIIAEQQARDAEMRGQMAEDARRYQTRALIGRQRTALAANGVMVDDGSALDITSDTAAQGEVDALTLRANAAREAYGYRAQGSNFLADAGLQRARADAAIPASMVGAGATLLSGAGTVGDRWLTYRRQGML